jgi:hypothetical protein
MTALYELDELQGAQFLGFVRSIEEPNDFQGTRWLPNVTINDLNFEYVLGASRTPVMATILGWDSEAPLHSKGRAGERVKGELPPIKRKARFGEKTLIRFLQPRAGSADVQQAIDDVLDMTVDLVDSVVARMEWLRLQALSEDKIVYNEDGVIFEFDYGITNDFQIDLTDQTDGDGTDVSATFGTEWTDHANSEPINDLIAICQMIEDTKGVRPIEFVGGSEVMGHLLANDHARGLIRGSSAPDTILTRNEIEVLFDLYNLPPISSYNTRVQAEQADGTLVDVRPLAQNKAFLVPGGGPVAPRHSSVGASLWGPTAESRELIGTPLVAQAPGIYGKTYAKEDPPEEYVKVAAVAMPSLPGADKLGQMTLWTA